MLIDTHCHINNIVKKNFDVPMSKEEIDASRQIIDDANINKVSYIINVGTSFVESENVVRLAKHYKECYVVIGIHPTDSKDAVLDDVRRMKKWLCEQSSEKIIGIGECGFDFYHEGFSKQKQKDFFVAHIELALEYDRALVIHSRDAYDETLRVLEAYKNENIRAVIHCFSYDQQFADIVIGYGFYLGIGGTITYPKNEELRDVVKNSSLSSIVLETDAPFLPIQSMRGKQNHPKYIKDIAEYIGQLTKTSIDDISDITTKNAIKLFNLKI